MTIEGENKPKERRSGARKADMGEMGMYAYVDELVRAGIDQRLAMKIYVGEAKLVFEKDPKNPQGEATTMKVVDDKENVLLLVPVKTPPSGPDLGQFI